MCLFSFCSRIHRMVVLSVMRLDVPDYMIGTMFENTFCIANKRECFN